MCGIAGSINKELDLGLLTECLYHRGPDEQKTFREGNLILHHHRLAIVDLTGGHQPMHLDDLTIIFNGEIYNHLEVRAKLGLHCRSGSDTETILHAYQKVGAACLQEFDGMFAFALLDRASNQLFLARDRAGKKPIYYYLRDDQFMFASELNAIAQQVPLRINEEHIAQYVRMGYFFKQRTPYLDVFELPAGSIATVNLATVRIDIKKWWNIHDFYLQRSGLSFDEILEETDRKLHLAVKRRIDSSDLEVGSFLSGGIDSGLVTAIASQYSQALKTFTVSFAGEYDEAPLARLVAERYGTVHQEIPISFDHLQDDIGTILANYGEPFFDSSAIPSYYVSKAARQHVTVILNGDGGDELFAGYRRYVPFAKYDFFRNSPVVRGVANTLTTVLPPAKNKKSKYNFLYRLLDFAGKTGLDAYLSSTIDIFEGYTKYLLMPSQSIADPLQQVRADFDQINRSGLSGLKKFMNLDFDNILAGDLLVKMDIATMAHSLEGRSPLMSKELLEFVPTLPDSALIRGGQTKYLLRTLAKKYLPETLIHQPKRGFEIPLRNWVDNQLKNIIGDHILAPDAWCHRFVDRRFMEQVWSRKINVGEEKRAKMIWCLFALEVWYKKSQHFNA